MTDDDALPADLALMEERLEAMLRANLDITARGVVREMPETFRHASDITRRPKRRKLLERFQDRQAELRRVIEQADKRSKTNLSHDLSRKNLEIAALHAQRDALIASHRAMIMAIGEMGGMAAWRRFFKQYEGVIEELRRLGALPEAQVVPLPTRADR